MQSHTIMGGAEAKYHIPPSIKRSQAAGLRSLHPRHSGMDATTLWPLIVRSNVLGGGSEHGLRWHLPWCRR